MTLWLLMAALAGLAAFWLTRPLWQRGTPQGVARATANVIAYQSRMAELEADIAVGVLPVDEARAIRQEMESRLLLDAAASGHEAPGHSHAAPRPGSLLPMLMGLLLCAFAGLWYAQAGSWRTAQQIATAPAEDAAPTDAEIEGMVAKLAGRLDAQPGDAEGWAMLGRSYFVMGRHAEAAKAYEQANTLTQSANADWLVNEGEALAMSRERDLLGRPAQLFEAALALQPGYGKALWYGALADAQASNFTRAGTRLQSLLQQELPDDLKAMVAARLDEMRELTGTATPPAAASARGTVLKVQITLAPALAENIPASATLFVFAKAAQGPPMPLAVQKLPGAKLPLTITLDDSMAMTPAMTLSQFERYVVTARYSASGSALAAPGDLEGSVETTRAGSAQALNLRIDRVVAGP